MTSTRRPVGKATRAALVVTAVAAFMNLVMNLGSDGFYTTFGLFVLLVLSDFGGPLRSRFAAYLVTGAVGMGLIVIGAFAATDVVATILVTLAVVFALCYSLVLRGYVTAAYISLLLTYIVAVTTPQAVGTLGTALAAYAAGAVLAGLAAVLLWPNRPVSAIGSALAAVLDAAVGLIADRGHRHDDPPPAENASGRLDAAHEKLLDAFQGNLKRPGTATARDRGLVRLVDDVGRLRIALDDAPDTPDRVDPEDTSLMASVQEALGACATAIDRGTPPADTVHDDLLTARDRHITALPARADELARTGDVDELNRVVDAGFADRVVSFITMMILRHTGAFLGRRPATGDPTRQAAADPDAVASIEATTTPWALLVANLHPGSPWLRRAVQVAVAVTISVAVIGELHLTTGFWVILGVVASLQLTAIRSRKSALQVLIGTVAGFVVCAVLVLVVGDRVWFLIGLLPFVGFLTVWFPRGKYVVPLTQAGYTVWFVMLVSLGHHDMAIATPESRIVDVSVGLAASLLVTSLLWPRGVASRVRPILDASVATTSAFFAAAVTWVTSAGTDPDTAAVEQAARRATEARDRAGEAFDLAISQGGATGEEADRWVRVANAVDHGFFAATMVRGLGDYGLAPVPDRQVGVALRDHAEAMAQRFVTTIHIEREGREPPAVGTDDPGGVDTAIARAVDTWTGATDEIAFEVPPARFTMSPGTAVISVRWVRNWSVYFGWMARHSEPDGPPPGSSEPPD